ncbi:MAG: LptF/LptG family permease [Rivularia sp. (in: Bacteria)]|nr:LptF/LptG family permease [Rivularia sp. MS3]
MMKKRLLGLPFEITLLDRYIIKELIPSLLFSLAICTILAELVGISFEQISIAVEENLPVYLVVQTHWLKLPAFICVALPFSLLISTIVIYTKLSNKNEIIALQSLGISSQRLIIPNLAIACILTLIIFVVQELIVPPANYQAAMMLETELKIDRNELAKYNKQNVIYQEFTENNSDKHLKLLFFADSFDGKRMNDITLIKLHNQQVREIVIASSAEWKEQAKKWELISGRFNLIGNDNTYIVSDDFEQLSLRLSRKILDYANHHRDNREMNLIDLY